MALYTLRLSFPINCMFDLNQVLKLHSNFLQADTSEEMTDLQEAAVFTVNTEECRRRYKDFLNENVTDTMICAGLLDVGGVDACIRDTGGPLYYNNDNSNVDVLVGIVSWGFWRACGDFTFPGVYTQVSAFTDWILANAV